MFIELACRKQHQEKIKEKHRNAHTTTYKLSKTKHLYQCGKQNSYSNATYNFKVEKSAENVRRIYENGAQNLQVTRAEFSILLALNSDIHRSTTFSEASKMTTILNSYRWLVE